jgi:hypothetical protein
MDPNTFHPGFYLGVWNMTKALGYQMNQMYVSYIYIYYTFLYIVYVYIYYIYVNVLVIRNPIRLHYNIGIWNPSIPNILLQNPILDQTYMIIHGNTV